MSRLELPPAGFNLAELPAEMVVPYFTYPELLRAVADVNEAYWYWTEMRRRVPAGADARLLWQVARQQRRQTAWHFALGDNSFIFNLPRRIQQALVELDGYLGGERATAIGLLSGQERNHLLVNARMEEAIASSQIEGASTTREVAKELLRARRKPLNLSERMIVNNYRTMRHLHELREQPLTMALLLELQELVTKNTLDDNAYAGRLRDHDRISVVDHVASEAVYQPPAATELPQLLARFCQLANDELESHWHPLVKASILHFLLGFIHPFVDGNGRTARAVFYWYLLRRNYALVEYLPISRIIKRSASQYARAYLYAENDGNDLTYFISYQLKVLQQGYQELAAYAARQQQQVAASRELLLTGHLNERQVTLLQRLREKSNTLLAIGDYQQQFNVVYQTARTDLMGLEELGLLEKKRIGKQKLLYFRAEDFDQQLAKLKA